jgi:hypothetical protein
MRGVFGARRNARSGGRRSVRNVKSRLLDNMCRRWVGSIMMSAFGALVVEVGLGMGRVYRFLLGRRGVRVLLFVWGVWRGS